MSRLWASMMLLWVAGCAHHDPLPVAPTVLAEAHEVKVPVYVEREPPPADLLTPLVQEMPTFLLPGQGDYCMTRQDTERVISAVRSMAMRQAQWRAWAVPPR